LRSHRVSTLPFPSFVASIKKENLHYFTMSNGCILAESRLLIKSVVIFNPLLFLHVGCYTSTWRNRNGLKNLLKKALANYYKIVYAFLRYPISVSRTVLVQGVPSHAGRGKEQLVTFARIWTRRITNISLRRSLVEFR